MGLKLEQFIFDAFAYSPSTALFEVFFHTPSYSCQSYGEDTENAICSLHCQVLREEEFAPVKNANGANFDTPDSARLLLLRLHARWVIAAGGFLTHSVPLYATGKSYLI